MKNKLILALALICVGVFCSQLCTGRAATITVTNTADSGPGTLRAAISNSVSGDTINFSAGLAGQTNLLASQLIITNSLTVDASALPGGFTLRASRLNLANETRILLVTNSATVTLNSLTLANGLKLYNTLTATLYGGGIYNSTNCTLNLSNCVLTGNAAESAVEAGLVNPNSISSTLAGNGRHFAGGAIYNAGNLTLNQCTLTNNSAVGDTGSFGNNNGFSTQLGGYGYGGAIYNVGQMAATNCFFNGNTARASSVIKGPLTQWPLFGGGNGGGIYNLGTVTLVSCSLSGNTAIHTNIAWTSSIAGQDAPGPIDSNGGGLFNQGTATLIDTTVSQNTVTAGSGGHTYVNSVGSSGTQTGGFARGGGVYNTATLILIRDTIADNSVTGGAGGQDTQSGSDPVREGGLGGDALGAGVFNSGTVTLTQTTLSGNSAAAGAAEAYKPYYYIFGGNALGGGLYNSGTATLTQVTFSRNSTAGGAATPNATPNQDSVASFGGHALGGGLYNSGTATLTQATFSRNSAAGGAATANLSITASFGGNALGGGVYNLATATCDQNTISSNSVVSGWPKREASKLFYYYKINYLNSGSGGGIYNANLTNVTLRNCLIAQNQNSSVGATVAGQGGFPNVIHPVILPDGPGPDLYGAYLSLGYNLVGSIGGTNAYQTNGNIYEVSIAGGNTGITNGVNGNLAGTFLAPLNPLLNPLGNYGGPTLTLALQPGSPGIDAGDDSLTNSFAYDQRGPGFPRNYGAHVDIGAVEFGDGDSAPTITALTATPVVLDPVTSFGSLTVGATIFPNASEVPTTVWFQYGVSTNYGNPLLPVILAPGNGTSATTFSQPLTPLASGLTWHYRWVAANYFGTNSSPDQTLAIGTPLYTATQYANNGATNFTAGIGSVTNEPNTYGLYTVSQLQALNVAAPLLTKNATNGMFTLTIGVQRATQLTDFVAFPMNGAGFSNVIDNAGNLKFYFTSTNNAAFFRLQSQ